MESGSVLELFTNPQTKTSRRFIQAINNHELPDIVTQYQKSSDHGSKLIRISFIGASAGEPVISDMIQKFNVKANILYGNIDHIKDTIFGTLTIQLIGENADAQQAINYLRQLGLKVEVMKVD